MAQPTYDELVRQNQQLGERIADLEAQVVRLTQLLDQANRKAKRQAAPFSKGQSKKAPKPPGRKPGPDYGTPAFRSAPPPRKINETHESVLLARCPACGGAVHETHVACQFQVEIPRRPLYRRFNVHVGQCACCGHRVQGRHALQTSDALGAAASQLGPDLQATIVQLNKAEGDRRGSLTGLSHGKIQRLLHSLCGIELSRGGSVQVMQRVARRCEPTYRAIIKALPGQPWIVPDETGWRIGGRLAWLHVFVARRLTGYVIDRKRGVEVAQGVLGSDYAGGLIHDGWAPYDRFWQAIHQQCLAHLLRRCAEMIEAATRGAVRFPRQVKQLLGNALELRDRREAGQLSEHGLAISRRRLEKRRDRLLEWRRADPANERLAKHLDKHRDQLFTFLRCPGIDATNWRAEQAIRPAVVNRKVWGGNRTPAGARAQSILMTVLRTCAQQHRDGLAFVSRVLRGQHPRLALAPT